MDNFSWQIPTRVIFGKGVLEQSRRYFKGYGKKAVVITGLNSSKNTGLLDLIEDNLKALGIGYQIESGVRPNPTIEQATEIVERQKKYKPKFIIAIGGGSVIDCSKAVAIGIKNKVPLEEFLWLGESDLPQRPESALPIVAIPTMPASGSEINKNAVLTWKAKELKAVIFHELLFPKTAIIDPAVTNTLTPEQSTYTAIDIISHALETYLSTNKATQLQDEISLGICKTVKENLEVVLKYPEYIEARKNIFFSGLVAQSGFYRGREGGWPLHWLEHPLSARYDIAHGLGLKMLLPALLKYDHQYNRQKIDELLQRLFSSTDIASFQNWLKKLPGEYSLPETAELKKMADDVLKLNSRFGKLPNIKEMTRDDIVQIYSKLQSATDI